MTAISHGVVAIASERRRQLEAEGFDVEHDDAHTNGEMVAAASCYLASWLYPGTDDIDFTAHPPHNWPWLPEDWKPSRDAIRNLVKAGALIAAEIDRLRRARVAASQAEERYAGPPPPVQPAPAATANGPVPQPVPYRHAHSIREGSNQAISHEHPGPWPHIHTRPVGMVVMPRETFKDDDGLPYPEEVQDLLASILGDVLARLPVAGDPETVVSVSPPEPAVMVNLHNEAVDKLDAMTARGVEVLRQIHADERQSGLVPGRGPVPTTPPPKAQRGRGGEPR